MMVVAVVPPAAAEAAVKEAVGNLVVFAALFLGPFLFGPVPSVVFNCIPPPPP